MISHKLESEYKFTAIHVFQMYDSIGLFVFNFTIQSIYID